MKSRFKWGTIFLMITSWELYPGLNLSGSLTDVFNYLPVLLISFIQLQSDFQEDNFLNDLDRNHK